jgi:hypothetical protein
MKVYKNPWVSRESYFVKEGSSGGVGYASLVKGYSVDNWNGKWQVRKSQYHFGAVADMPVVAENRISLQRCIDDAIKDAILSAVHDAKDGERK